MESTKEYLKLFNACPIKIGDTVRVLRGWKNGDYGYVCVNDYVVNTPCLDVDYVVTDKYDDWYEIGATWYVPFFVLEVVKSAPVNTATTDDYLAFHNASGLKVGDSVRVVRKAEDYEMGWGDQWAGYMNDYVGHVHKITDNDGSFGWELDHKCDFPTFVLQKVDSTPAPPVPITEEIIINKDSAVINGKVLTKEEIGKLYYKVVRCGKKVVEKSKVHNPKNLTAGQYEADKGYRLLDRDEIRDRVNPHEEIELWLGTRLWDACYHGVDIYKTYRTKLSREELVHLK